jgi:ASC-1-like (ASCH) protein
MKQLRFRAQNRDIFLAIKDGRKKVETRAASPKFSKIKAGNSLLLKCGKEKFEVKVKKAKFFSDINGLLNEYRVAQINPGLKNKKELEKMYYSFPGYRGKLKRYGIVAFEL